jgi:hypothetical protein
MSLKGRPQTPEHIAKRNAARNITLSKLDWSGPNSPSWRGGGNRHKRYKTRNPCVEKFNGTKARAKLARTPHGISLSEFREWFENQEKKCVYCEVDLSVWTVRRMDNLSIDRKHNEIGYVSGNICFACGRCNTVKGNTFTFDEMLEIGKKYIQKKRLQGLL